MISLYFGLPRSGKTTTICKRAIDYHRRFPSANIYCNVRLNLPYVQYIHPSYLGKYDLHDGLILLDEGSVWADSRDYKQMSKQLSDWLMLHGHWRVDVEVYTQRYSGVDVKIRNLCERLYWVRKTPLLGFCLTSIVPIQYRLVVPEHGEKLGEIVEGYRLPSFLTRILQTRHILRPLYYRYFDSWDRPPLPPLP